MLPKKITSPQHPNVKHWICLKESASYRKKEKKALIVGEKQIREHPFPLRSLIQTAPSTLVAEETFQVSESLFKKITALPQGVAAVVDLPSPQDLFSLKRVLIFDQIQDPGNTGTLLRSAWALGWEGALFIEGGCDPFNDKALRAGQGAIFHLPYQIESLDSLLFRMKKTKTPIWVADLEGMFPEKASVEEKIFLVLSQEGRGARNWPEARKVTIPMTPHAESLNVASAGAILLYTLKGEKP